MSEPSDQNLEKTPLDKIEHNPASSRPSAHDVRRLSVEGEVHPRTVLRAYSGEPIRSLCAARIERAAAALGITPPPARSRQ